MVEKTIVYIAEYSLNSAESTIIYLGSIYTLVFAQIFLKEKGHFCCQIKLQDSFVFYDDMKGISSLPTKKTIVLKEGVFCSLVYLKNQSSFSDTFEIDHGTISLYVFFTIYLIVSDSMQDSTNTNLSNLDLELNLDSTFASSSTPTVFDDDTIPKKLHPRVLQVDSDEDQDESNLELSTDESDSDYDCHYDSESDSEISMDSDLTSLSDNNDMNDDRHFFLRQENPIRRFYTKGNVEENIETICFEDFIIHFASKSYSESTANLFKSILDPEVKSKITYTVADRNKVKRLVDLDTIIVYPTLVYL
jgi:hypothetical protein